MTIKITINNNVIDIKSELINIYKKNTVLIEFVICYIVMFFIIWVIHDWCSVYIRVGV